MKKTINILMYLSALVSSIILICTFLTTYNFYYVNYIFTTYKPIQFSVGTTMALVGFKFVFTENRRNNIIYSFISFFICACLIYFGLYL